MKTCACLLVVMLAPPLVLSAAAQNVLEEARRHYYDAAYEEALSTLATADRASRTQLIEVEQYRALCFIALGRTSDAESAITAIVEADPLYVPSASPKVQLFISEVRRNVLPGVARRLLESGRAAFTKKDFAQARGDFELLQRVVADPAMKGQNEIANLRALTDGFVTLLTASFPPSPEPELERSPAVAPVPPPVPVVSDEDGIRETLRAYEQAYINLDAASVSSIVPSIDASVLDRSFRDLRAQEVKIAVQQISITGNTATVVCDVYQSATPRVGMGVSGTRKAEFRLQKDGGRWIILARLGR